MIIYTGFQFAAPPHVGVPWFLRSAQQVGLGEASDCDAFRPFPGNETDVNTLRVSIVRHPGDWLLAYHRHGFGNRMERGEFARLDRESSFVDFVRRYLKRCPGAMSRLFLQTYRADSYLRFEELAGGFSGLARSVGVEERLLVGVKPPAQSLLRARRWNEALRRDLLDAERDMMDMFLYT